MVMVALIVVSVYIRVMIVVTKGSTMNKAKLSVCKAHRVFKNLYLTQKIQVAKRSL